MSRVRPSPVPGLEEPFPRVEGVVHCGAHPIPDLAGRFGTPVYLYDGAYLERRYLAFRDAFAEADPLIAYSVKANGNLAVLARLGRLGAGADIVSGGELHRVRRAGIPPERIVFSGVGKTAEEMRVALREGIYGFNVESEGEMALLSRVAREMGRPAPLSLRVNPDILSPTPHEYTRTGHGDSKFGIPASRVPELYRRAHRDPWLEIRGIDVHIGSQIVDPRPYGRALNEVLALVDVLEEEGIGIEYLDLGGGFGVAYGEAPAMILEQLTRKILPPLRGRRLRLVLEPGRYIVGQAGVLVTRVLYVKEGGERTFVITDSGMTDLIRPSHYGGFHEIEPVVERPGSSEREVDVVGPICESGDFLGLDREIAVPEPGDLLVVRTVGAYGFTMASNYNARRRPPEVMVDGEKVWVVRERETLDDLVRGESIPPEWAPGEGE